MPGAPYCVAGTGGPLHDALFSTGTGNLELTEAWQIGAGVSIAASSTVSFNIDGAYGEIDHAAGPLLDYDYWGAAGNVVWKPVSGLAISAEVQYRETNPIAGSIVTASDRWNGVIRFQRSF